MDSLPPPPPAATATSAAAYAPGDIYPRGQREEELCARASHTDWLYLSALLVLDAEVEIAGPKGLRKIPLGELYVEDGLAHLTLGDGEMVVAVHLPSNPPPSAYRKVRLRGAIDYPLAGVAAALRAVDGKVVSLRIGLTGTNSRPFLLAGMDAMIGGPLDEKALQEIDRQVQKQVQPMRTTTASAHYRRLAAAALARRLVGALLAEPHFL